MDSIHVKGGVALRGKVRIQGSKNAALPILAASLLTKETTCITNCPKIADVHRMISLLRSLGAKVRWGENGIRVNAFHFCQREMPTEAVRGMRSSLCLLGALIGRCGEVKMEYSGGCRIGERPIDIHLDALQKMGVCFREEQGMLYARAKQLHGAVIRFAFPSVGATENVLLAAVMAEGDTTIYGAAKEPEVVALCEYLERCGAWIEGVGTGNLCVKGGRTLYGADYRIPSDRIVAGTYLFGAIATGGCVWLENAPVHQMEAVLEVASGMGTQYEVTSRGLMCKPKGDRMRCPLSQQLLIPVFRRICSLWHWWLIPGRREVVS